MSFARPAHPTPVGTRAAALLRAGLGLLAAGAVCAGRIAWRAVFRYVDTDGELRAASFGYYAFFALFPLFLVFVYVGVMINGGSNKEVTDQIFDVAMHYFPAANKGDAPPADTPPAAAEDNPSPEIIKNIKSSIVYALNKRNSVTAFAFLMLVWSSMRFFQALVHGVNRAWGTHEYPWWRLPFANLGMMAILASTLLIGLVVPNIVAGVLTAIETFWHNHIPIGYEVLAGSIRGVNSVLPWFVLFCGLVMFYKYAPRRKTLVREVWFSALCVTMLLQLVQKGFAFYWGSFARFDLVYGALGGVIAILMWIYLTGSVLILGGCLCAAQSEILTERENARADREGDGAAS